MSVYTVFSISLTQTVGLINSHVRYLFRFGREHSTEIEPFQGGAMSGCIGWKWANGYGKLSSGWRWLQRGGQANVWLHCCVAGCLLEGDWTHTLENGLHGVRGGYKRVAAVFAELIHTILPDLSGWGHELSWWLFGLLELHWLVVGCWPSQNLLRALWKESFKTLHVWYMVTTQHRKPCGWRIVAVNFPITQVCSVVQGFPAGPLNASAWQKKERDIGGLLSAGHSWKQLICCSEIIRANYSILTVRWELSTVCLASWSYAENTQLSLDLFENARAAEPGSKNTLERQRGEREHNS